MKKLTVLLCLIYSLNLSHLAWGEDVVVYMRDSLYQGLKKDLVPLLKNKFNAKIILKPFQGHVLIRKLKHEKDHQKVDLIVGLENNFAAEDDTLLETLGLYPHALPHFQEEIKASQPSLKGKLIPFCYSYLAFLKHHPSGKKKIESMEEFITQEFSLVIPDPRTSDVGFGFLLWIYQLFGADHLEVWKRLKPRIVTFPKGWQASYMLFINQEAQSVISYTTSELAHDNRPHSSVTSLHMKEGHAIQIWSLALSKKGAKNKTALEVAAYFLSKDIQTLIPENIWSYPALTLPLPPSFERIKRPKALIPLPLSPQDREKLIAEWLSVMMR